MIRFACPGCSATFTVDDAKAGKQSKCPKCQAEFVIPAAEPVAEAQPPALPKSKAQAEPPADPNEPVEIDPCPKCGTRVTVMPSDLGSDVECPSCANVFTAKKPGRKVPAPPPAPPKKTALESTDGDGRPRKSSRRSEDDEDDRPSKRRPRDDDDEDERPSKRRAARDDDDEDDRPRKSSRRRDDDEEDDDRPRRKKKRRSGGSLEPHRGVQILIFGILSCVCCVLFGFAALNMANADLAKMDEGRMDDSGAGLTKAGKIIALVSFGLFILGVIAQIALFALGGKR